MCRTTTSIIPCQSGSGLVNSSAFPVDINYVYLTFSGANVQEARGKVEIAKNKKAIVRKIIFGGGGGAFPPPELGLLKNT